jgi:toluene monooxygenase system ferredoxin subunit
MWRRALAARDLWEGDLTAVDVDGQPLLLVRLPGGEVRAYEGRCPHLGATLADGEFDGRTLSCSAHGWQFDLQTGHGVNPAGCALDRFEVSVQDDDILVLVAEEHDHDDIEV